MPTTHHTMHLCHMCKKSAKKAGGGWRCWQGKRLMT